MHKFLNSQECPNFVKAEVERAKQKAVSTTDDSQIDSDMEVGETDTHDTSQPEWIDLIQPNSIYAGVNHDFEFNDGGPDYNWSSTLYDYPHRIMASVG